MRCHHGRSKPRKGEGERASDGACGWMVAPPRPWLAITTKAQTKAGRFLRARPAEDNSHHHHSTPPLADRWEELHALQALLPFCFSAKSKAIYKPRTAIPKPPSRLSGIAASQWRRAYSEAHGAPQPRSWAAAPATPPSPCSPPRRHSRRKSSGSARPRCRSRPARTPT